MPLLLITTSSSSASRTCLPTAKRPRKPPRLFAPCYTSRCSTPTRTDLNPIHHTRCIGL
nr:MAG TPA: hypothetical protein [Caudoviricetes sp.]